MGYWQQTAPEGGSFATDSELLWGDAVAEILDAALAEVISTFRHDIGRLPSLDELRAGFEFSAPVVLGDVVDVAKTADYDKLIAEGWREDPAHPKQLVLTRADGSKAFMWSPLTVEGSKTYGHESEGQPEGTGQ